MFLYPLRMGMHLPQAASDTISQVSAKVKLTGGTVGTLLLPWEKLKGPTLLSIHLCLPWSYYDSFNAFQKSPFKIPSFH